MLSSASSVASRLAGAAYVAARRAPVRAASCNGAQRWSHVEAKLKEMGIELPEAGAALGSYVATVRTGNLVFTGKSLLAVGGGRVGSQPRRAMLFSPCAAYLCWLVHRAAGHLPFKDGSVIRGRVGQDTSVEEGAAAAQQCTINLLASLKGASRCWRVHSAGQNRR